MYIWPVNLYFKCIKLVFSGVTFLKRADAKEPTIFIFVGGGNRILFIFSQPSRSVIFFFKILDRVYAKNTFNRIGESVFIPLSCFI